MATTDLKLDEPGTLPKPGPIGRLVRLGFGAFCVAYVVQLVAVSDSLVDASGHVRPAIFNGILPGLFLISYVINIGFSRAFGKWPAIASGAVFLALAGFGYLASGNAETALLARTIWAWELYLYSHLGLSFLLAGLIGTPGCEMRALHHLYSRITGNPTKEHYCPVGPLHPIDQWEANRGT